MTTAQVLAACVNILLVKCLGYLYGKGYSAVLELEQRNVFSTAYGIDSEVIDPLENAFEDLPLVDLGIENERRWQERGRREL